MKKIFTNAGILFIGLILGKKIVDYLEDGSNRKNNKKKPNFNKSSYLAYETHIDNWTMPTFYNSEDGTIKSEIKSPNRIYHIGDLKSDLSNFFDVCISKK